MSLISRRVAAGASLLAAALGCSVPVAGGAKPAMRPARLPPVAADHDVELAAHFPSARLPAAQEAQPNAADSDQPFVTPERLERGYTLVVVGVNGDNLLSAGLAPGLVAGGYAGAVEVVDWTTGFWPLFVYHLRASGRHRDAAQRIAQKVAAYQTRYPGREVNLVGYSAGAVVAVKALEELSRSRQVDRVVLLAGAISPLHDMQTALERSRVGIWSYYQPQDVVALWAGTLLAGTADGHHLMSAGAVGFWRPPRISDEGRRLYSAKLVQVPYRPQMVASGNLGGHFQCTGRKFVAQWIAPLLAVQAARDADRNAGAALR